MNDEVIEIESIPTKIKYKNIIWIPISTVKVNHSRGNPKKTYITKWVEEKSVGDIFTKEEFYKQFPKHKHDVACRRRVDEAIQDMILERRIEQWEILGQYKVLKL